MEDTIKELNDELKDVLKTVVNVMKRIIMDIENGEYTPERAYKDLEEFHFSEELGFFFSEELGFFAVLQDLANIHMDDAFGGAR